MTGDQDKTVPTEGDAATRYRAFLSYSHADDAAARRLHRRLETYRLPKNLSRENAPDETSGEAANRLGPIFRDREDFPAAVDLSESVKRALDMAGALIVLCSPDARASPWVAKEIVYFRDRHPGRPILAALLRGEPGEAFPPALTEGAEPLAADLRPEGDGRRTGFLKLVAGLAGVPLDALVQRDAQRRLRRVTAVTLASLVALIVMAGMTILALQSRNEAERQRAEAEGLIEYMLTDLREDLRGVGRLDVMTDVNERAMDYYEGQGDLSRLGADSLERRARVIGEIGEDDENRGDLDLAQSRYEELYRTTAALLTDEADNPERIFSHAKSENRLALLAYSRNRLASALSRWTRARRLLASISAWGTDNSEWIRVSAYVEGNICAAKLRLGRASASAVENCLGAVRLSRRLARRNPTDGSATYDLIFHQLWLADALIATGRHAETANVQRQYLRLVEELVASDPANMLWLEQQMQVYIRYAEQLELLGRDANDARHYLERARAVNSRLIARDPSNAIWATYEDKISTFQ
ncbi:MAG: toll/interleukin-1 receptor domain-containing protein [Parasphingopyxis sp.]|nr:TIR domain-containing protein [Sphingomonadales bacterium]